MHISNIGHGLPLGENVSNDTSKVPQLNGRKISQDKIEEDQKLDSCWKGASETSFESEEMTKGMIGKTSFISNDEFSQEEDDVFFEDDAEDLAGNELLSAYESGEQLNVEGSNQKSVAQESRIENIEKESENIEKKLKSTNAVSSGKIEAKKQEENLPDQLTAVLVRSNAVYKNREDFQKDIEEIKLRIVSSPGNVEIEIKKITDRTVEGNNIGKIVNGQFVPLTKEEKEKIKEELHKFFKDYFIQFSILNKAQKEEEKEPINDQKIKFIKDPDNYTVVPYTPDRRIFSDDSQNQVTIKLIDIIKSIILSTIMKEGQEKVDEQRKLEELESLRERILAAVLKSEILKSQILASEVKLKNFHLELNQTINIPILVLVNMIDRIKNLNKPSSSREKTFMALPGIHKIVSLAVKATI